jgi:hypothetical protein
MIEYYEIIDGGETNIYHFLFYMIANFLIANIKNEIVYYYPNKKNCKVSEGFLSLLPQNFKRHYEKDPNINYISFMHAIPIFKDYALPESYSLIRFLFQSYISPTMIIGRKIYIQRKNIKERTFINESEVQSQLEKLGYKTILLEDYDVKTQIRIVSEAEFIVGAHGAGLAFTVFCNSKAKVLEIYQGKNSEKRHYYHIAHILKHSFMRFQDCIECDKNTETMFVNTSKLVEFLNEWHHNRLF